MGGTVSGGKKARDKNYENHGADFYKHIGAKGGKLSRGYAFGHGKVDPAVIGAIGGKISRRSKAQ